VCVIESKGSRGVADLAVIAKYPLSQYATATVGPLEKLQAGSASLVAGLARVRDARCDSLHSYMMGYNAVVQLTHCRASSMSDVPNPYDPPTHTASPEPRFIEPSELDVRIARYAQLGLRLLGVMLFFEGFAGLIGSVLYGGLVAMEFGVAGYAPLPDSYTYGWFVSSLACMVFGLYLMVGGRWILESVFLPAGVRVESQVSPVTEPE
jgi:hypothetical protein